MPPPVSQKPFHPAPGKPFVFSGIADEAAPDLATQIGAHRELGWNFIELRTINGIQFTDLDEPAFEEVYATLAEASMGVSAFASAIANWACKITDPLEKSVDTLARAIPRMRRLGTRGIRVMSYLNDGLSDETWRDEAVRRFEIMAKMAEDGGVVLLLENCDGWASQSAQHFARFFELVDSPALKVVYDTGNPASHGHTDTWDWYRLARPHIAHVHLKAHSGPGGGYRWPDEGQSCIRETLADLLATGYRGFISIEPHIAAVIHTAKSIDNPATAYQSYIEYGRRVMKLVDTLHASSQHESAQQ